MKRRNHPNMRRTQASVQASRTPRGWTSMMSRACPLLMKTSRRNRQSPRTQAPQSSPLFPNRRPSKRCKRSRQIPPPKPQRKHKLALSNKTASPKQKNLWELHFQISWTKRRSSKPINNYLARSQTITMVCPRRKPTGWLMWTRSSTWTPTSSTTAPSSPANYWDLPLMLATWLIQNKLSNSLLIQIVSSSTRRQSTRNLETLNSLSPLMWKTLIRWVQMERGLTTSSTVRSSMSHGTLRTPFQRSWPRGSLWNSAPKLNRTSSSWWEAQTREKART